MKALYTNLLVRFVVREDEKLAEAVRQINHYKMNAPFQA